MVARYSPMATRSTASEGAAAEVAVVVRAATLAVGVAEVRAELLAAAAGLAGGGVGPGAVVGVRGTRVGAAGVAMAARWVSRRGAAAVVVVVVVAAVLAAAALRRSRYLRMTASWWGESTPAIVGSMISGSMASKAISTPSR